MTDQKTQTRPTWATALAIGFRVGVFGAFLLVFGFLFGSGFLTWGAAVVSLGAMIAFIGAFGYYFEYRK